MTKLQTIAKAIKINGHLPVPAGGGRILEVHEIRSVNGKWMTDALRSDLCGYVTIKRSAQALLVRIAEGILAREAEITARREADRREAMGQ